MRLLKNKKILNEENKRIITSAVALISANFLSTFIGFIVTLVQGRYVSAELLGYYKQFTILSGYLFFFQLGTYQALQRLIPLYYGDDNEKKAYDYTAVAYAWNMFVTIVISIIFVVLSVKSIFKGDYKAAVLWAIQIIISSYTIMSGVLSATYRSFKDFERLAKANTIGAVATLISIPFFIYNPFVGLIVRNCISVVAIVPLIQGRPIRVHPHFDGRLFLKLIKQGTPIFTASYVLGVGLDTVRNTFVLSFAGIEGLGFWNFAFTFYGIEIVVPNAIIAVISPRIIRDYGEKKSISLLVEKYRKIFWIFVLVMVICGGIGGIIVKILIPILLPNYTEAVPMILILLLCLVLKCADIYYSILLAVNELMWINLAAFLSSIFQILFLFLLHRFTDSLLIFPFSIVSSMLVRACLLVFRVYRIKKLTRKGGHDKL